ncbi:hypothetical protein AGMMS49928_05340 [Spirochaetia bacterium]|nr:hypothetical protein AGMMS49928_05340 [Spirochaetia bacterium]
MRKKLTIRAISGLLVLLGGIVIASCFNPMDTPNGVQVKGGSADFALPLGSKEFNLADIFSAKKLGESIGEGSGIEVYDYAKAGVQTFLLYYPIDGISVELDAESFNFEELDGASEGTELTVHIPEISPYIGADITSPLPIPVDIPLPTSPISLFGVGDQTIFQEARIKSGYIRLGDSGDDFSNVTIKLNSSKGSESTLIVEDDKRSFSLAGKTIYGDTTVTLGGFITISPGQKVPLKFVSEGIHFETVEIRPTETLTEVFDFDMTSLMGQKWLNSIKISELKIGLKLEPSIGGLPIRIENALFWPSPGELVTDLAAGISAAGELKLNHDDSAPSISFTPDGGFANSTTSIQQTITIKVNGEGTPAILTLTDIKAGESKTIKVTPELEFNWEEANIDPSGLAPGVLDGSFPDDGLNIAELLDMGDSAKGLDFENVEFEGIKLHIYMDGPSELLEQATLELFATDNGVLLPGFSYTDTDAIKFTAGNSASGIKEKIDPVTKVFSGDLPHGLLYQGDEDDEDISDIFNDKPTNFVLNYCVSFDNGVTVKNDGSLTRLEFRPEVIIELPFKFTLKEKVGTGYAALQFSDLGIGDGDLMGRKPLSPGKKDPLSLVKKVGLDITYDNSIGLDGVEVVLLLQSDGSGSGQREIPLFTLQEGNGQKMSINLGPDDFKYPFIPKAVEFRTLATGGKGELSILRGAGATANQALKMQIKAVLRADLDGFNPDDFEF